MHLRILIVDSDPEDLLFVEEAIREVEQSGLWKPWMEVETLAASTWLEVEALLPREPVDAILLSLDLQDSQGAALFRRAQNLAPTTPILLLIEPSGRELAVQLVREGAQDYLIKKQIDCAPLSQAIRNALERQRILEAARADLMTDPLTGTLRAGVFFRLAERDRQLARQLARRMLVIAAEPANLDELAAAAGEQQRDLMLMEAGEFLRGMATDTGIAGRIAGSRFALVFLETPSAPLERLWSRIQAGAQPLLRIGAAIFEPGEPTRLETLLERAQADLQHGGRATRSAAARI